jgi:hypothetical protein
MPIFRREEDDISSGRSSSPTELDKEAVWYRGRGNMSGRSRDRNRERDRDRDRGRGTDEIKPNWGLITPQGFRSLAPSRVLSERSHSNNGLDDEDYVSQDGERPPKRLARHRSGGHAQRRGRGRASGKGEERRNQQRAHEVHNIASAEDIVNEAAAKAAHPKSAARPKGKGRGQGQSKGEEWQQQWQPHTPALQHNIISLLVSLAVVGARTLRELTGVVFVTYLIDSSTELVKQMAREGQKYYEATVGVQDHQLGPPHVHIWAAMVKCLRSLATTPPSAMILLNAYWDNTIMLVDRQELEEEVKYCRVRKCWQRSLSRLQFSLSPMARTISPGMTMTMEQAISMSIKEAGGTRKRGAPPRSAMEREAEKLLLRFPREQPHYPA